MEKWFEVDRHERIKTVMTPKAMYAFTSNFNIYEEDAGAFINSIIKFYR